MGIYQILVSAYNQIISVFPPVLQWLLTVALLVGVVVLFVHLIRSSWLFVLLLVLLLPVLFPLVWSVFLGIWHFLLYLLVQVGVRAPAQ
ncbi:MAG TPA: hypothetical protein VGH44_02390 [Candidatus Saccharimonadia bacterium]|jgi:hypothetical protein